MNGYAAVEDGDPLIVLKLHVFHRRLYKLVRNGIRFSVHETISHISYTGEMASNSFSPDSDKIIEVTRSEEDPLELLHMRADAVVASREVFLDSRGESLKPKVHQPIHPALEVRPVEHDQFGSIGHTVGEPRS